jgi:hypothetical protein
MALLVVDFSFLDGRDGEIVVKELALADSRYNRISSYLFVTLLFCRASDKQLNGFV